MFPTPDANSSSLNSKIVAKFGGTSVKNAQAIRQVAKIVKQHNNLRFVVVSAISGITNLLMEFCHALPVDRLSIAHQIEQRHGEIIQELGIIAAPVMKMLNRLNELMPILSLNKQEMDHILALGEDLSYILVAGFFQKEGINIKPIDARQFIKTDDHFGKATPNPKAIKACLQDIPEIENGIIITQGFIGATQTGHTTTLGRGGGDYSAALIAEGLEASELFIYTDVPGVYTIDPNLVRNACLIRELSFQEMAEMANFGAKILHPATLEPCLRVSIPIHILSTFEPEKPGTLVNVTAKTIAAPSVRAITLRKSQVLVTVKSLKMLDAYGFLANIFRILAEHKISVDLITTSEVSVALTIDGTNLGSHGMNPFRYNADLLQTLEKFAEVTIEEDYTLIAIVGSSLTTPGMIQKIMSCLESKIIRLICFGASQSSIGLLVPKQDANAIAQTLHEELVRA